MAHMLLFLFARHARDPAVGKILPRELRTREEKYRPAVRPEPYDGEAPTSRWSA
ncbi:MAG TPA: hypothetical protein VNW54_11925 [Granulicella sp.]|nr:hypothetical protein [Granulicella sp.]